jgi:hypothetical protein
MKEFNNFEY